MKHYSHRFYKLKPDARGYYSSYRKWLSEEYRPYTESVPDEFPPSKHPLSFLVKMYPEDFDVAPFYHLNC